MYVCWGIDGDFVVVGDVYCYLCVLVGGFDGSNFVNGDIVVGYIGCWI